MSGDELTLEELGKRTGVEPRTLRSWVSDGLLSPPLKSGRGARYPASNINRALAVLALKDIHGLSMSEIGRRFMVAAEDQLLEWASERSPTSAPRGSARDYLSRIQGRSTSPKSARRSTAASASSPFDHQPAPVPLKPQSGPRGERSGGLANIERLILQLEQLLQSPIPRRSRGALWTRISVTPDLEFSVRGDLEPRERILFEQLADQFRAILTGGPRND
ncbi:helix-turn-helix domain-containing protein [Frankia sp. BMG5.11]|uniref:helix-turn-helix domain-containing protein n=1 Tax=Parafrankia sp. BMG5.11 TaxID=222540 RepID=UPI00103BE66B|nr:MerR family transcriptional regulator [Parafrankia sp. BMG5.11]